MKRPTGILRLRVYDRTGAELWSDVGKNLIVAQGYEIACEMLAGVEAAHIAKIAVGTNGIAPQESDTLITNSAVVEVQSVEYPEPTTVRFNFTIGYEDAVGMQIREFGLMTADGRLFSRKVRASIEKTKYMTIVGAWDINM